MGIGIWFGLAALYLLAVLLFSIISFVINFSLGIIAIAGIVLVIYLCGLSIKLIFLLITQKSMEPKSPEYIVNVVQPMFYLNLIFIAPFVAILLAIEPVVEKTLPKVMSEENWNRFADGWNNLPDVILIEVPDMKE